MPSNLLPALLRLLRLGGRVPLLAPLGPPPLPLPRLAPPPSLALDDEIVVIVVFAEAVLLLRSGRPLIIGLGGDSIGKLGPVF